MNHDDHKPDISTLIDPELEARIVAWVSGEASPFEAAELTRLTNEKPELAIFQRRIAAVSGLVGEAIRPDSTPLRLAPERRAKLLQALGATENKTNPASTTDTIKLPLVYSQTKKRRSRQWMLAFAASLTVGLFTLISFRQYERGFEMAAKKMRAPQESMPLELPLAEYSEPRAQADGNERHEIAFLSAVSEKDERQRELKRKDEFLKAREEHYKQAIEQATKRKKEREAAEIRSDQSIQPAALAKSATRGLTIPPPPPGSAQVFDSYNSSPTLAGNQVRTELKDVGSTTGLIAKYESARNTGGAPSLSDAIGFDADKKANTTLTSPHAYYANPNAPALAEKPQAGGKEDALSATIDPSLEQIVLSPFTVSSAKEKGYAAQNTIAGIRVRQLNKEKEADVPLIRVEEAANRVQQPDPSFSEISAAKEPVSTFSLHVSDVSFHLAQAALAKDEAIDRSSIRPEEFYNAFSYGDPTPALAEKVSCRIEQAAHPFAQQRNLVRIAVKVAAAGRDAAQPLHLTVLLDTSGSMEREDRAATIQSAMKALTSLLGPNDRLTLIGFSRQPRLLAESLSGDQAAQVLDLIKNTPAEGGTNLEEALKLGSELAHRQFAANAQNRIVLLTDGAANLGNANPAQLAASIEALRQSGIAFDACGVGLEGLDDGMLENLTRKGDGRYYVLNSPEAADAGFAKQLAGAFRPAAENVKLQVRFNPARVGHYRLIGFEQHRLKEEDFRNDKVDAAELAAEEAAVAVYQVEALPQGEGELGEVYVRFRDTSSGNMVERSWTLNYDAQAPAFDRANPSMQLAGTAALLAEKLQGGEAADAISLADLAPVVNKLRNHYANEPRVQELVTMFEQARKLAGE